MAQDFRIEDFLYPLEMLRLKREFDRHCRMSRDEIHAYQTTRLRETLTHAYRNVPYYRERWDTIGWVPSDFRWPEDISSLPLLTKADLRASFENLKSHDAGRYAPRVETTSGTTGAAIKFLSDKSSRCLEFVYYWRYWGWSGYQIGDRVAEFSTTYFLRRPALRDAHERYDRVSNRLMLNNSVLSPERLEVWVKALTRFKPKFIKGMPGTLLLLSRHLAASGFQTIHPEAVFTTGETLRPAARSVIEKAFGCPCRDSYGHMERTVAASECHQGRLHLNSDYGFCELPVERGSKEAHRVRVVGTSLHNRAMPLIRYETGDELEMSGDAECACGLPFPIVERVIGRETATLRLSGDRVIPNAFLIFDDVPGLVAGQIVQRSPEDLLIRAAVCGDERLTGRVLAKKLEELAGEPVRINFESVSEEGLYAGSGQKFRSVIGLGEDF